MLFSVIIPTCNRDKLLCRCLDRILPPYQQLSSELYEVIVADDNADDHLVDELKGYYPTVKVVKGPRRGPAANRNAGARMAKGRWLVFIDDDCLPGDYLLSTYKKEVEKNHVKVLEGCTIVDRQRMRFDEEAPYNWFGGNMWSCNFAIEKDFFFGLGGFDEKFIYPCLEDVDLRVRIERSETIAFVPLAVVVHEWRRKTAFRDLRKQLHAHKYFYKKHSQYSVRHIFSRISRFFKESVKLTAELLKYSFKGFWAYIEKMILYFLLIFA